MDAKIRVSTESWPWRKNSFAISFDHEWYPNHWAIPAPNTHMHLIVIQLVYLVNRLHVANNMVSPNLIFSTHSPPTPHPQFSLSFYLATPIDMWVVYIYIHDVLLLIPDSRTPWAVGYLLILIEKRTTCERYCSSKSRENCTLTWSFITYYLYFYSSLPWFWSCLPLWTAACLLSVSYSTLYFWHPHTGNPTIQTQDSRLSHLLLLWTQHLEFTPTRP